MNNRTVRKRLLDLADLLGRVPPKKFDMTSWARNLPPDMDPANEEQCGTSACALGWATTLPWARKLGARLDREAGVVTNLSECPDSTIAELFGHNLFLDAIFYGDICTPKKKATQIRKFVVKRFPARKP